MQLADKSGLLVLIKLPLGWMESDHPYLFGTLPDLKHVRVAQTVLILMKKVVFVFSRSAESFS